MLIYFTLMLVATLYNPKCDILEHYKENFSETNYELLRSSYDKRALWKKFIQQPKKKKIHVIIDVLG